MFVNEKLEVILIELEALVSYKQHDMIYASVSCSNMKQFSLSLFGALSNKFLV